MAGKIDFKKTLGQFYNPSQSTFHLVDVPEMSFLMLDGKGDPNTSGEYQTAVEALYTLSYAIKFFSKTQGVDFVVPPLEGLWWMENMAEFNLINKGRWEWTMMIMQPGWITAENAEMMKQKAIKKKNNELINLARFESYAEGLAVQTLYLGAYANEALVIAQMHEFIVAKGYRMRGKHHEVYLSDPRKTSPEKLKTILRQPVIKV
jgi:hypothetical protein